jgi:Family of unknown function (DUF6614)/Protein of unknown function (DUF533)
MGVYQGWFNLREGASDLEVASAFEAHVRDLQGRELIAGWRLLRRKLGLGPAALGEFQFLVETDDLAQLDAACRAVSTRSGDIESLHHALNSKVKDSFFALYRDFPDPHRQTGEERSDTRRISNRARNCEGCGGNRSARAAARFTNAAEVAAAPVPVGRVQALLDRAAEDRVRPVGGAGDVAVLYRIEVHVVHRGREVAIVADRVFPIAALPDPRSPRRMRPAERRSIDGGEMSRIMGKLNEDGADSEARDFMMSELQKPLDLDSLVRGVKSPEVAVQVYGASLLAIEVDTQAERDYLQQLAEQLGRDGETVERLHAGLGVGKAA